jgi:hypothetical protein
MRRVLMLVLAAAPLAACSGSKTACFALSDEDATRKVIAEYEKQAVSARGDATRMQLSATRVVGIGRSSGTKGDGKAMTQIWFSQDDKTVTLATLTESCELQFRPGVDPEAVKQAAIPVHAPNF